MSEPLIAVVLTLNSVVPNPKPPSVPEATAHFPFCMQGVILAKRMSPSSK